MNCGTGNGTAHSSVPAFHGLRAERLPERRLMNTSIAIATIPTASTNPAAVENRFSHCTFSSSGYVYTRRGMPSSPVRCIGRKVRLKPRNTIQNAVRDRLSEGIRPVASGSQ